jgi:hypothetical protein
VPLHCCLQQLRDYRYLLFNLFVFNPIDLARQQALTLHARKTAADRVFSSQANRALDLALRGGAGERKGMTVSPIQINKLQKPILFIFSINYNNG